MVQIDIPVAFALGGLHADAARDQLRTGQPLYYARTLVRDLLFFILLASWLPIQLLVRHFGFETSHMWWHEDSVLDYPLFIPVFTVVYAASNVLGFVLGVKLVRAGHIGVNRLLIAAGWIFATAWVVLQAPRTLVLGTYRQWLAGTAPPVSSDRGLVQLLVAMAIVWSAALVVTYRQMRAEGRRAISNAPGG